VKQELQTKTIQLDSYRSQLKEQQEALLNKDTAVVELKKHIEKIKAGHDDEIKVWIARLSKSIIVE